MIIYPLYVFNDKLVSPANGHECKRINKCNIKNFGFDSIEHLREEYPNFPLRCHESQLKQDNNNILAKLNFIKSNKNKIDSTLIRKEEYYKNPRLCTLCNTPLDYEGNQKKFCSRSCSGTYSNLNRTIESREKQIKSLEITNLIKHELKLDTINSKHHDAYFSRHKHYSKIDKESIWRKSFPKSAVYIKKCDVTGKWYVSHGNVNKISPFIKSAKEKYYSDCMFKFNVYEYPEWFNLKLLDTYGWYSCPRKDSKKNKNLNGISRDHLVSISEGFKNGYDPKIISHPANCVLMQHKENHRKNYRSSITYEELKQKVVMWDIKFGIKIQRPDGAAPSTSTWKEDVLLLN